MSGLIIGKRVSFSVLCLDAISTRKHFACKARTCKSASAGCLQVVSGSARKRLNLPENCKRVFFIWSGGLFGLFYFCFSFFSRGLSSRRGCRLTSQPRRALIASACSGDAVKSPREWSPVLTASCWPAAPAAPAPAMPCR